MRTRISKIVILFFVILSSISNVIAKDFELMYVYRCKVMVGDSLCYLVRKDRPYRGNNKNWDAVVTSTVKIPPTATAMGTTEYSVSGTYDGFSYSSTKDIQDIPATGGGSDEPVNGYTQPPALALTLAVLSCLGMVGAVVLLGRRTV